MAYSAGGLSDAIGGIGGSIGTLFGSRKPPKAIQNRLAALTSRPLARFGGTLLGDVEGLSKDAVQNYLAGQGKQTELAGQQENILNQIIQKRLSADPNALLQQIGNTAFGFIDPNVVSPLAKFDVTQENLMRRARGLNPAAVDSTADRLRNARVASQRYYDVAKQAYGALPGLYNEAFGQGLSSDQAAAALTPQIAAGYESVANRPFNAINQRIGTAGGAADVANKAIQGVLAATQGYQTPQNWADRLGAASQQIGQGLGGVASLAGLGAGGGGGL